LRNPTTGVKVSDPSGSTVVSAVTGVVGRPEWYAAVMATSHASSW
jgi:hypothetical protein